MENNEIKALIEKYHLVRQGDKVGTYQTKGIDKAAFTRDVGTHKAEIIAYFDAEEKAAADLRIKRKNTFEAIPGVLELRKARSQRAEWKREFNHMMETGSSKMRNVESPTPEEITSMESNYPMAVFALEAEYRAHTTQNYQLSTIWNATYDALCDGNNPETVKADHDNRMKQYTTNHLWD